MEKADKALNFIEHIVEEDLANSYKQEDLV